MSRAAAAAMWKLSSSHSAAGGIGSRRASSASSAVGLAQGLHVRLELAQVRAAADRAGAATVTASRPVGAHALRATQY